MQDAAAIIACIDLAQSHLSASPVAHRIRQLRPIDRRNPGYSMRNRKGLAYANPFRNDNERPDNRGKTQQPLGCNARSHRNTCG
jgi:hypothetical protein